MRIENSLIGVLKINSSNYRSICRAFAFINKSYLVIEQKDQLEKVSHIIIPGVSKFGSLIEDLNSLNFLDALYKAKESGKAILGLCAGMQIMGKSSEESKGVEGLGWLDFEVTKINGTTEANLRSFHTGWNDVVPKSEHQKINVGGCYYFNHSYFIENCNPSQILGTTEYGNRFVTVVGEENIIGAQFHPEKSQNDGLKFLKEFSELKI
jgi:glutamine amidotransferase